MKRWKWERRKKVRMKWERRKVNEEVCVKTNFFASPVPVCGAEI